MPVLLEACYNEAVRTIAARGGGERMPLAFSLRGEGFVRRSKRFCALQEQNVSLS